MELQSEKIELSSATSITGGTKRLLKKLKAIDNKVVRVITYLTILPTVIMFLVFCHYYVVMFSTIFDALATIMDSMNTGCGNKPTSNCNTVPYSKQCL